MSNIFPHCEGIRLVVTMVVPISVRFEIIWNISRKLSGLLCKHCIAQFIKAKNGHFGVIFHEAVKGLCLGHLAGKIKEAQEHRLMSFRKGFMTKGGCDVCLAYTGRPHNDHIAGFFKPVGVHELHKLVPGDFGIELPVKVAHELDPLDPGHPHEVFDSFLRSLLVFLRKEPMQELFVFFMKSAHIGK